MLQEKCHMSSAISRHILLAQLRWIRGQGTMAVQDGMSSLSKPSAKMFSVRPWRYHNRVVVGVGHVTRASDELLIWTGRRAEVWIVRNGVETPTRQNKSQMKMSACEHCKFKLRQVDRLQQQFSSSQVKISSGPGQVKLSCDKLCGVKSKNNFYANFIKVYLNFAALRKSSFWGGYINTNQLHADCRSWKEASKRMSKTTKTTDVIMMNVTEDSTLICHQAYESKSTNRHSNSTQDE